MVVDDSAFARRVHRRILESAGYRVVEAASGMAALELFALERPELVLLDLSMEDLGGIEVLRELRAMDPAARVVVVSADVQRSTEQLVMEGGALRFLGKPVAEASLLRTVSDALESSAA